MSWVIASLIQLTSMEPYYIDDALEIVRVVTISGL